MKTETTKKDRIEIRVSAHEKEFLKKAQQLNGDTTLSNFAIKILKDKADKIITENDQILASKRDREKFFDAVFADVEPNQALLKASEEYKSINDS